MVKVFYYILPILSTILFENVQLLPKIIKIGGLFETNHIDLEKAFSSAVDRINSNESLLPGSILSAQIEPIEPQNSFRASKRVCSLLKSGVAAIFGPQSTPTSSLVGSLLDSFDIPHIETRWDFRRQVKSYSVNLYPHWETLAKAYKHLVKAKGWKSFTILYEENEALIRMQWLLQTTSSKDWNVSLRKIKPEYRPILKELKDTAVTNIVLDCKVSNIRTIFKQAQQIGIMTDYHSYIITNLDLHTVNLEEFRYSGTNITGFRLVDPNNSMVKEISLSLNKKNKGRPGSRPLKRIINTQTGLIYDAVALFSDALEKLDRGQTINIKSISCDNDSTWSHGHSLINYMKMSSLDGLTGIVKFDTQGFRSDIVLDVIELTRKGLIKSGEWSLSQGINFTRSEEEQMKEAIESLRNKTLRITTVLNDPYTMRKESWEQLDGNERFEGFCVDLIKEIAKKLNFKYIIHIVPDQKPGKRNPATGEWDGMIGELINGSADLAMGDLTITYEREEVVDFTMPFMNLGIGILFRKPSAAQPSLFTFLSPLSWDVWLYMLTAYIVVSLFLFIVARFSPYEWNPPHPCNQEVDVLKNQFTLTNSLWFTVGSLMQQGSEFAPKAWSTRTVAGTWWFFNLIMISSYTANLAAFLTVQKMVSPIESAEDLVKQTKIKYGCYAGGSTEAFFINSKIETYRKMWAFMESARPSVFATSGENGIRRVLEGDYAYLMETTSIEYVTQRMCNLTQIGGSLDSKGYGIATPQGSPYRQLMTGAILQLQEETMLDVLKIKWWKQKRGGGSCSTEHNKKGSTGTASELSLANVGGVFVVLLCGIGCAIVIAILEFIWKSQRMEKGRNPLCLAMCKELKFAVNCDESSVRQRQKKNEFNTPEPNYNFVTLGSYPSMSGKEPVS